MNFLLFSVLLVAVLLGATIIVFFNDTDEDEDDECRCLSDDCDECYEKGGCMCGDCPFRVTCTKNEIDL